MLRACVLTLFMLASDFAWGCACGCGLFDVGTSAMFPTSGGGVVSLEYDFVDQDQNRSLGQTSAGSNNDDKEIRTSFLTAGAKYMFNRTWGMQVQVPVWFREFTTADPSGNINSFHHAALGDIRISGVYTGFSEDMSTGLTFGAKLATGDATYPNFDSDTEIGTGSTDLLVGAYHLGRITDSGIWDWFVHVNLDQPIVSSTGYLPGNEIDAAFGAYYDGFSSDREHKVVALLTLLAASRGADAGSLADPVNTGYRRLLIAPGLEGDIGRFKLYGDVELPVYQYYNGNQLAATVIYKSVVSYAF